MINAAGTPSARASLDTLVADEDNAIDRWLAVKRRCSFLRGISRAANNKVVPKTTNADVLQLATWWSRELAKLTPRDADDRREHARWRRCLDRVAAATAGQPGSAIYARNEEFWQTCCKRLAIYLESRKVEPSPWELAVEAVTESVDELPSRLAGIPDAVRRAARAVRQLLEKPAALALVAVGALLVVPSIVNAVVR